MTGDVVAYMDDQGRLAWKATTQFLDCFEGQDENPPPCLTRDVWKA
jgi:hypothetical protein